MRRGRPLLITVLFLGALAGLSAPMIVDDVSAAQASKADDLPVVVLDTTAGTITLQLDRAKAPISVDNFLKYVDKGFYDGLVFHRVIPGFMIQGGGMKDANNTLDEKLEGALSPIKNESSNGLRHARGTLAMARKPNPDSATSQFFINHANNRGLDQAPGGYTVFGKVIDGMDVVDAIAKAQTTTKKDTKVDPSTGQPIEHENVPVKPIVIKAAKRKA